ncbi:MAG: alpha-galactosidase [Verrucomicrobia bacterium]|nr:alpha-galactosidase [Verrucomicrobiota bacterium]
MKTTSRPTHLLLFLLTLAASAAMAADNPLILTPPAPLTPRINGPSVFGVRPGSPFLYTIPATGERPMQFSVDHLPKGLCLEVATGRIMGELRSKGEIKLVLRARNARGTAEKKFRIICGDRIALTPPMGWNSWNCWAEAVDQDKVLRSARSMVASGLINHGWSYINIDDTWQGKRGGPFGGLQSNEKFPDMKQLCHEIHAMGLKAGIYSTPWITSYAKFAGGSSDRSDGRWDKTMADAKFWRHGKFPFANADARQWAAWGFDYLKYDWNPNDVPHVAEMSKALRRCKRDIIYSLSNSAPFAHAADWAKWANCWRTTGDIWDHWNENSAEWQYGISEIGFIQERWAPFAAPGHWNDPDMLVLGYVGWGPKLHQTRLTPNQQYSHISMWCMLSAPLLIGCDMDRLDPFTLNLLSNDEVLALNQDALGRQAVRVGANGAVDIYLKDLEDGSKALGFFNRSTAEETVVYNKLGRVGLPGKQQVRDLWRQKDLADVKDSVKVTVPAHGVVLLKLTAAK